MKRILTLAFVSALLFACKKENSNPDPAGGVTEGTGVVISHEGAYTGGTGTVSFYNPADKSIVNGLFMSVNGVPVGNLLQSIAHIQNKLYLVVSGADKLVVANENTLDQEGEITGFSTPRYMLAVSSSKAYVTNWGTNSISVIDLTTNTISKDIPCGNGPEKMAFNGSELFVSNSGGYGLDSTVFVIDVVNDVVTDTIYTGYKPNSLVVDADDNLWILCGGISDWNDPTNDVAGKLIHLNYNTGSVLSNLEFPNNTDHPADLTIDALSENLFYLSNDYEGSVFSMHIHSTSLPSSAFVNGKFYALGVDPQTGDVYTSDAKGYMADGMIHRFTNSGLQVDSAQAGFIPNGFVFK